MEPTGERYLPEKMGGDIELEHYHRYELVGPFATGKVVLDAASGEGYGSNVLARYAKSVTGLDISIEAVSSAAEKYSRSNLRFQQGSVTQLPFDSSSFDLIVSFETLEHLVDHDMMICELKRVLKPDGVLIISTPDRNQYSTIADTLNEYHVRELTKTEFRDLLERHFSYIDIIGQKVIYNSLITPIDVVDERKFIHFHINNDQPLTRSTELQLPLYFIAIASAHGKHPKFEFSTYERRGKYSVGQQLAWANTDRATLSGAMTDKDNQLKELSDSITSLTEERAKAHKCIAELQFRLDAERTQFVDLSERHRQNVDLIAKYEVASSERSKQIKHVWTRLSSLSIDGFKITPQAGADLADTQADYSELRKNLDRFIDQYQQTEYWLNRVQSSKSWKITRPLRVLGRLLRGEIPSLKSAQKSFKLKANSCVQRYARRIYHQLPFDAHTKFKLRRIFMQYVDRPDSVLAPIAEGTSKSAPLGSPQLAIDRLMRDLLPIAEGGQFTHFYLLPFWSKGGAEYAALSYASSVRRLNPNNRTLIICTDTVNRNSANNKSLEGFSRLPVIHLSDYSNAQTRDQQTQACLELVGIFRPRVLHNINSEVGWNLILKHHSMLRPITRLFASIFAMQYVRYPDKRTGYAEYFLKEGLPFLHSLTTDNVRFIADATQVFKLSSFETNKLRCIYLPNRIEIETRALSQRCWSGDSNHILYAGRIDADKRIELLNQVIATNPGLHFHLWGAKVIEGGEELLASNNSTFHGPYVEPADFIVSGPPYLAFIFTSKWEGLPNSIVEVGSLGIPVIAPSVGGIEELISPTTGYLLPAFPTAAHYTAALNEIKSNPSEARKRAKALQSIIIARHSASSLDANISALPDYL